MAVAGRRQPVLDSAVEALTSEGIKAIGVQVTIPMQPDFSAGHVLTASTACLPLELITPPKQLKDVCAVFISRLKEV